MEASDSPTPPVLIVADAVPEARRLLGIMLSPLASPCIETATVEETLEAARGQQQPLILLDLASLPGDALAMIETLVGLDASPMVCAMSAEPTPEEEARALLLGAIGYLEKPVVPERVAAAIRLADVAEEELSMRRRLTGPLGYASALDSRGRPMLRWIVENVSPSGLFLRTTAPLHVGELLRLELDMARVRFRASVRVQRSQAPSWLTAGGIGVEFVDLTPEVQVQLDAALHALGVAGGEPSDPA